jgi:M6 family metalloprotease-like protein
MYKKITALMISILSFQSTASTVSAFENEGSYQAPLYEFEVPLLEGPLLDRPSMHSKSASVNESEKNLCNQYYQLEYKMLVIAIEYNNQKLMFSEEEIRDRFFSTNNSVASYYNEATAEKTKIIPALYNNVNGILTISLNRDHPGTNLENSQEKFRLIKSDVKNAIDKAVKDDLFNFSSFDSDRNGKLDTNELALYFIFAGYEEAYSGNEYPNAVWSHRNYMYYKDPKNNISINDFAVSGEVFRRKYFNPERVIFEKGIVAHELGHLLFCLPDLYRINKNKKYSGDLGNVDLMASGSWNSKNRGRKGSSPSHFSTFSLSKMNLLNVNEIDKVKLGNYSYDLLFNNMDSNIVFNKNEKESYFFEARGKTGSDSYLLDGLLITKMTKNLDTNNFLIENLNRISLVNELENFTLDDGLVLSITEVASNNIEVTTLGEEGVGYTYRRVQSISKKNDGGGNVSFLFTILCFVFFMFNKKK